MPAHCNLHKLDDKRIEKILFDYAMGIPSVEIIKKHKLEKNVIPEVEEQKRWNIWAGTLHDKRWFDCCYRYKCKQAMSMLAQRFGVKRMRSLKRENMIREKNISDKVISKVKKLLK